MMRRALALAGCGVLSVGLAACESTEQESAKIGRESDSAAQAAAKPAGATHAAASHGNTYRIARGAGARGPRARGAAHGASAPPAPGKAVAGRGSTSP